jgi:hypothetical protein
MFSAMREGYEKSNEYIFGIPDQAKQHNTFTAKGWPQSPEILFIPSNTAHRCLCLFSTTQVQLLSARGRCAFKTQRRNTT